MVFMQHFYYYITNYSVLWIKNYNIYTILPKHWLFCNTYYLTTFTDYFVQDKTLQENIFQYCWITWLMKSRKIPLSDKKEIAFSSCSCASSQLSSCREKLHGLKFHFFSTSTTFSSFGYMQLLSVFKLEKHHCLEMHYTAVVNFSDFDKNYVCEGVRIR